MTNPDQPALPQEHRAHENTDREIWRERPDDYYADALFVTERGSIGFDIGGNCVVMPAREWFKLAKPALPQESREEITSKGNDTSALMRKTGAKEITSNIPTCKQSLQVPQEPSAERREEIGLDELEPGQLRPCPFCGGEAERVDNGPTKAQVAHAIGWGEDLDAGGSFIHCKRCDASTALHFDRKENLVSSWNDRARAPLLPVQEAKTVLPEEARKLVQRLHNRANSRDMIYGCCDADLNLESARALEAQQEQIENWSKGWADTWKKLEEGTLHVLYCSADRNSPVGNPGCSCPHGRPTKALHADRDALSLRVEAAEKMAEALRKALLWSDDEHDVGPWREEADDALAAFRKPGETG